MKTKQFTFFALIVTGMIFSNRLSATTHTVQVGNYYFNPSSLNVMVGDSVKWVWVNGSHTTTSTSIPAGAASWDSPINSSNQTYLYQVTVAGTYQYKCTPHAGMGMVGSFVATQQNTLSVSPSQQTVPSSSGSTSFTVQSNASWTASSDASWCSVNSGGIGNGTITATYQVNHGGLRTANITVMVSGVSPVTVQVVQDAQVGIADLNSPSLSMYPNPVISKLTISSGSSDAISGNMLVFDINGRTVAGPLRVYGTNLIIDFSTVPAGVYFVRIENSEGNTTIRRIIKQ